MSNRKQHQNELADTELKRMEDVLRENEARFRSFMDNSPTFSWMKDSQGRYVFASRNFRSRCGLKLDDDRDTTDFDLFPPDVAQTYRDNDRTVLATNRPLQVTEDSVDPDGSVATWLVTKFPFETANGEQLVGGVGVDITERRRVVEIWRKLSAIVESSYDAIYSRTLDGTITSWNPSAERLYGYSAAEMLGQAITVLVPSDSNELPDILRRVANREYIEDYETVRVRKDGSLVDVSLRISPILDASGVVVGVSTIARDISERKRLQEAKELLAHQAAEREIEQQFQTLANGIPQLCWIATADGWVFWYNQRFFDYTGTTLEDVQGWGWQKVSHPDHIQRVEEKVRRCLATGEDWEDTFPLRRKDGDYRWFLSRGLAIRDTNGKIVRWFGTNTDVSELREAQEAEVQEREERLRLLSDNLPNSVVYQYTLEPDGSPRFLYVSAGIERLLGVAAEDVLKDASVLQRHIFPHDLPAFRKAEQKSARELSVFEDETRIQMPDRQLRWLHSTSRPRRLADGRVIWDGVITDITERKQATEAWRNLSAIVESSHDAIIGRTLDGTITSWNRGAERLYGYSAAEMLGQSAKDFIPHNRLNAESEILRRVASGKYIEDYETVRRRKDGSLIDVSLRVSPILDASGVVVGVSSIARDISERKIAEEKLRLSEQRYRSLVKASSQLVWTCDPDGNLMHEVEDWHLFTGQTAEKVRGWGWLNAVHPEDRDKTMKAWQHATDTKSHYVVEYRLRRNDGVYRVMQTHGVAVLDCTGQVNGWVGMSTDVTEQRLAQEALLRSEKLAVTGRLAATISHEVNNPLGAAMNAIYLARTTPALPSPAGEMLQLAERELRRAAHITQQTLGFYRDNGNNQKGTAHDVVKEVLSVYAPKLRNRNVTVHYRHRCSSGSPREGCPDGCEQCQKYLCVNAGELRQVISNLLANGIDALSDGGTMYIRTSRSSNRVRLTMADNGHGIRTESLKRIFEPFFTTKKDFGTGLGLWVTRELVGKYNGVIKVRSSEGKGTVFRMTFPQERTEDGALRTVTSTSSTRAA